MRAPKITTKMTVSAKLILNTWQAMVNKIKYDYIGKTSPIIVPRREWAWVEPEDEDDYTIKALLIHNADHDICIYSDIPDMTGHVKINDEIVNPYSSDGNYHYYEIPSNILAGDSYYVTIGIWQALPLHTWDYQISKPWEVPKQSVIDAQLLTYQLNDFTSGTPTVEEWDDVSTVINAMDMPDTIETIPLSNMRDYVAGLTDVDNVETVAQYPIITHGYDDLHIRFMLAYPVELNADRVIYTMLFEAQINNSDGDTVYRWHNALSQIRNDKIDIPTGTGDINNIGIQSSRGFEIGDKIQIEDVYDTELTITALSGADNEAIMSLHYDNSSGNVQYIWNNKPFNTISDDTYYNDSLKIHDNDAPSNEQHFHIVYPTDSFVDGEKYNVTLKLTFRRHSGSTLDPYGHQAIVYFVGEYERYGQPQSFGLLPMTPFEECDPIPGLDDKSINAIIQNVRKLQSVKGFSNVPGNASSEACYHPYDNGNRCNCTGMLGIRKLSHLAYNGRPDSNEKATIHYWDGTQWKSEELSSSETLTIIDLKKKFPSMIAGNFYYIEGNIMYAFEVSDTIELPEETE